jgi:hypothetical protein
MLINYKEASSAQLNLKLIFALHLSIFFKLWMKAQMWQSITMDPYDHLLALHAEVEKVNTLSGKLRLWPNTFCQIALLPAKPFITFFSNSFFKHEMYGPKYEKEKINRVPMFFPAFYKCVTPLSQEENRNHLNVKLTTITRVLQSTYLK